MPMSHVSVAKKPLCFESNDELSLNEKESIVIICFENVDHGYCCWLLLTLNFDLKSLKKKFPVDRLNGCFCADLCRFICLPLKNFIVLNVLEFSYQNKEEQICGCPSGHNYGHTLDRKSLC